MPSTISMFFCFNSSTTTLISVAEIKHKSSEPQVVFIFQRSEEVIDPENVFFDGINLYKEWLIDVFYFFESYCFYDKKSTDNIC